MYGKKKTSSLPDVHLLIDGWNGISHHRAQNVDLVIVAAAPAALRAHARNRGWEQPGF